MEPITPEEANALLREDIAWAEHVVNDLVRVTITQGQFDALVDWVFNLGVVAFRKSELLEKLNKGDFTGAAHELYHEDPDGTPHGYIYGGGKVRVNLVARRKAERELWEGRVPDFEALRLEALHKLA